MYRVVEARVSRKFEKTKRIRRGRRPADAPGAGDRPRRFIIPAKANLPIVFQRTGLKCSTVKYPGPFSVSTNNGRILRRLRAAKVALGYGNQVSCQAMKVIRTACIAIYDGLPTASSSIGRPAHGRFRGPGRKDSARGSLPNSRRDWLFDVPHPGCHQKVPRGDQATEPRQLRISFGVDRRQASRGNLPPCRQRPAACRDQERPPMRRSMSRGSSALGGLVLPKLDFLSSPPAARVAVARPGRA